MWRNVPPSEEMFIPDVKRELYQLIGISSKDNSVTLLHYGGDYTRDDIKLPQDRLLRGMMVEGFDYGKRVLVAVVSALGKDAVCAVEVDQTGSAISFTRNEDALNQSKTKDSDVVVNQSKTKNSDVVVNQSKTKDSDVVVDQSKTKNSDVVVNQSKTKDSDVVVDQSKTKNSDVAKKASLKEEATKALLSTAKYGHEYAQRSYRDVVLGHNATSEDISQIRT